jgi:TPP-dependent pyruvate/acetoin dehydrogenase alpha subunit
MNIRQMPKEFSASLYESMVRIRRIEEKLIALYPEQEMRCPTHFSVGQEAAAVGVCAALRNNDLIYSGHRNHAHYVAKGGSLKKMVAELYGKATGCTGGKGGSMHLEDHEAGVMGASAIVGSSVAIALGAALASVLQGKDRITVAFIGDSAVETGVFNECLHLAALKKLPIIFACENNLYATQTPLSERQPLDNFYARGEPIGTPGVRVDGNNVLAVHSAAVDAVQRCIKGEGPSIIESLTYRWHEHVGPYDDSNLGYRSIDELAAWKERCPVSSFRKVLVESGIFTDQELSLIEGQIDQEVTEAVQFAQDSPMPSPDKLWEHVY